jgi:filamentous hemagglutinin family protein
MTMQRQLIRLTLTGMTLLATGSAAIAQTTIIPDTTLGNENSLLTTDAPDLNRITGGATRGGNLFHSFSQFAIGTNQTAWFDNSLNIQNILVRVTGQNRSDIDGTLRANGNADLFLLNPNGISVGTNAKLNIGGAFSALTTAAIPLGEQAVFSATAPTQSQLLSIKPSVAFDLARFQPQADITFKANWEPKGQAINLIAKNITFNQAQINNPAGNDLYKAANDVAPIRINLQAAAGITIQDSNIGLYGGGFRATTPGSIVFDNSRLLSQSRFEQPAEAILFQGGQVEILNKSGITVPTTDDLSRTDRINQSVVLDIRSAGAILINSSRINQPPTERPLNPATFGDEPDQAISRVNLAPLQITLATPQDITIQNSAIALRGGAFQAVIPGTFSLESSQLYSDNFMAQNSAPITIQAQNIRLDRYARPQGQARQVPDDDDGILGISANSIIAGSAATINLSARNNFSIKGVQGIGSNTLTNANAGDILLAAGNIYEMDIGGIGNQSRPNTAIDQTKQIQGNNGQIMITAKNIKLNRFGFNMDHFSQGGNGRIVVQATETIEMGDGGIGTNARGAAIGANILVQANELIMRPKSALSTSAEKQSQGGNIRVEANRFQLQGSVATNTKGDGKAGDIDIIVPQVILDEGLFDETEVTRGTVSSFTGTAEGQEKATGDSGNIRVTAIGPNAQVILNSGAGIANTIFKDSTGSTGQIVVQSGQIEVQDGSQIIVATNSDGNAGLINVQATQSIKLVGSNRNGESPSGILSTIQTSAKGGSSAGIVISTPLLDVRDGAGIISSTLGQGDSGKVEITADRAIFSNQTVQGGSSGVLTSVGLGLIPGGDLLRVEPGDGRFSITTLNPLVISKSDNAAATGNSGEIKLNVGQIDILQGAQLVTAVVGGGRAGNVKLQANRNIRLSDRAAIKADSGSGQGGSISITSQNGVLLLRHNSQISAVSRAIGKDGNIALDVPFIVGIRGDNSDIFAVSQDALNGGQSVGNNIEIKAQGILGFAYRNQFTNQNDIIATGNVTLNLPDIDPSRGLTILPTIPIDIAQKIDRRCNANDAVSSSAFVARGSGGLPANPSRTIVPNGLMRLATLPDDRQASDRVSSQAIAALPVEAQTALRLADGRIQLRSSTRNVFGSSGRSDCFHTAD